MHLSVVDNWRLGELVNNIHTVLLKEFASREIIANSTIYVCPGQLGVRLTIDGLHCKKKGIEIYNSSTSIYFRC